MNFIRHKNYFLWLYLWKHSLIYLVWDATVFKHIFFPARLFTILLKSVEKSTGQGTLLCVYDTNLTLCLGFYEMRVLWFETRGRTFVLFFGKQRLLKKRATVAEGLRRTEQFCTPIRLITAVSLSSVIKMKRRTSLSLMGGQIERWPEDREQVRLWRGKAWEQPHSCAGPEHLQSEKWAMSVHDLLMI